MCRTCSSAGTVPETADFVESADAIVASAPVSQHNIPAQQYPAFAEDSYPAMGASVEMPDYIISDYSRQKREALLSTSDNSLSFIRTFWTLTGWIISFQILSAVLMFYQHSNSGLDDPLYHIISTSFGMVWTILMTFYVIFDIQSHELRPSELFNFSFVKLREFAPRVLKYFAGAAGVVLFFSLISSGSILKFGEMSRLGIVLSFVSIVIVAPICEEMIFRGYLYTALRSRFSKPAERITINAMLFASAHVFLVMFFFGASVPYYIFALGYFLAKLYEESNSVVPGIALHMLNNGLVFLIEWLVFQELWFSI